MKNILIVEDNVLIGIFIKTVLLSKSYNVIAIVKNANECLKILNAHSVDLIIMDINLEGSIDGIALARQININAFYPVIFLTAYYTDEIIEDAMGSYVLAYVVKPAEPKDIIAALNIAKNTLKHKNKILNNDEIHIGKDTFYNKEYAIVKYNKQEIKLAEKEKRILKILVENKGSTVSIENIKNYVWEEENVSLSSLRVKINSLKNRLVNVKILSVYGEGYILKI